MAYACIGVGALAKRPALRNDISYGFYVYAFPVQQMLAVFGVWKLGILPFFLIATATTLPFAAASWFLVERPLLKLKKFGTPLTTRGSSVEAAALAALAHTRASSADADRPPANPPRDGL